MKIIPLHFKRVSLLVALLLCSLITYAQTTISTGYTGTTNSGTGFAITFVVENNSGGDILLTDVENYVDASHNGTTSTLYYSSTSLSGTPGAFTAPTWNTVASNTLSGISTAAVQPVITGMSFLIPNNTIYRFALFTTGTNYYASSGATNTFTQTGVSLYVGNYQIAGMNVGYGATNNPRYFAGSITFVPATPCSGQPGAGTAVSNTPSVCPTGSAMLSLTGSTVGAGITYQWEESPAGANMWTPITGGTSSGISVSPTSPTDYRAVVTCTNGGLSDISTSVTISQSPFFNCYCIPTNAGSAQINNVNILGTTFNHSTGTAPSPTYYNAFPDTGSATATLVQGASYPVTVSFDGSAIGSIWIDYNQDGVFDATEWIQTGTTGTAHSATINVPLTAMTGQTGMRVRSRGAGNINGATDACLNMGGGETEDYVITIAAAIPCSGQPVAGTASGPDSICLNTPFNLTLSGYTLGSGITFQWEESPAGANMWMPIAGAINSYATIPGITAAMDYRAVITCANGGLSDISNTITVVPNPFYLCYCGPNTGINLNSSPINYLTNVEIPTTTLSHNTASAASPGGYALYWPASSNQTADLAQGMMYTLNTTHAYTGYYSDAWIDFDGNGTFDASEFIDLTTTGTNATATFIVPSGATPGLTGMRVRLFYTAYSAGGACNTTGDYETEDYVVNILATPPCSGPPTAGTATGPLDICAGVPFNLMVTGQTIGTGIVLQWEESPAGANMWTAIPGATNPLYTVSNQTSATDYRLMITCTNGGLTDISNVVSVAQNAPSTCYCTPIYTTACSVGDDIRDVILTGDVAPGINNMNTPCPANGYDDYTAMSATLSAGVTYSGNVTTNYGSTSEDVRIWIDYGADGIFDAADEIAYIDNINNASSGAFTFTVPASTTPGTYRMRVRLVYGQSSAAAIDPCISYTYGEAHDYTVVIMPPPSCLPPTNASAGAVLSTSGTFNWTASTSTPGMGYEWRVVPQGATPFVTPAANGTVPTGTTASVTGLSPATSYTFWVRSVCSATDTSSWVSTNFVTACAAVAAPYLHDVESQTTNTNGNMTNCWVATPTGTGTYTWHVSNAGTGSLNTGPAAAHSGTKFFFTEASYGALNAVTELTTPEIDVSTLTLPMLEFWYHMYGANINKLVISVSDGVTWTPVDSLVGQQQTSETAPWQTRSVVLSGYTGTIQVKFTAIRGNGFEGDISLDDIAVIDAPTCVPPTNVNLANVSSSSVDISWPASATTATGYEWAIDQTSNPAPDASTTINTTAGTGPVTASGLSGGTLYYVHLRADCGTTNGLSAWAVYPVTTRPVNDTCQHAIDISSGTAVNGSTYGATESMPSGSCATSTTYANDVWYYFHAGAGTVTITATNTVGDVVMEVFSGSCGSLTSVDCQDIPAVGTETSVISTSPGIYYVRVYGFLSIENPFVIQASGTPLAIGLGSFDATAVGQRVRLDWNTFSETPGDRFTIERSANGHSFSPIGSLAARGEASTYSFWDEQPVNGTNYYRLKMVGANGTARYSEVAEVTFTKGFSLNVWPNPVTEVLNLAVTDMSGPATVTVADLTGKTIRVMYLKSEKTTIDMAGLAQGVYLIHYADEARTETIKVNKQ